MIFISSQCCCMIKLPFLCQMVKQLLNAQNSKSSPILVMNYCDPSEDNSDFPKIIWFNLEMNYFDWVIYNLHHNNSHPRGSPVYSSEWMPWIQKGIRKFRVSKFIFFLYFLFKNLLLRDHCFLTYSSSPTFWPALFIPVNPQSRVHPLSLTNWGVIGQEQVSVLSSVTASGGATWQGISVAAGGLVRCRTGVGSHNSGMVLIP